MRTTVMELPRAMLAVLAASFGLGTVDLLHAADCSNTSTGNIPINDLGTGTYQGVEGGLYPLGSNERPASHDRALDRTGRLVLLDAAGNPDPINGVFVLISIGNSNATQEFTRFQTHAAEDPDLNSRLVLVDCAKFQQGADVISNPNAEYWTLVDGRLAEAGVTPAQIQAVWLKEAEPFPTEVWPEDAIVFLDDLRAIAQILKSRYPNTKSIYHTSRIYGGYSLPNGASPEPHPYHYGFSVKWLLEEQLDGSPDLNFDPAKGPVLAPWMSWGPYLWADGLVPRSDGLIWECSDFMDDGTHTSSTGRDKVAFAMLDFFKTDSTTAPWFVDCNLGDPDAFATPPEVLGDLVTSLPGGEVEVRWDSLDPVVGPSAVYDVVSGLISELRADAGFGRATCLASGLLDTPYSDPRPDPAPGEGTYYVVRGRNSCGIGTFGDSSLQPDPRDALDAGSPGCP